MLDNSCVSKSGPSATPFHCLAVGWIIAFAVSFSLYALTANRGVQWQDSGDRALRIYIGQLNNPLGLALTHPLHHWLGRLAVAIGSAKPMYAITLVSALAAAAAVANLFGCVLTVVRHLPAAVLAAASLALANTFWQLATITEVYTLTAALLAAECWCLLAFARGGRRGLFWGMLFFNGLGLANHLQAGLTTPVLIVVAILAWRHRRITFLDVLIGAALWLLGTLPYTGLVLSAWLHSGDLAGTLRSAVVGNGFAAYVLNVRPTAWTTEITVAFLLYNFPNLLLPAAVYGVIKAPAVDLPPMGKRALLAGLILNFVFVCRYNVVDQYTFFLPVYVLLSIFGGLGFAAVWQWASARRRQVVVALAVALLAATPLTYWATVNVLRRYDPLGSRIRHKPYRDDYRYLLSPWSVADTSAERMSRHAVELAGRGGFILSEDCMANFAIEFQARWLSIAGVQIYQWPIEQSECSAVLNQVAQAAAEGRRVVLVPLDRDRPAVPAPTGHWRRDGDLYVLDPGGIPASMGSAS